MDVKGVALVSRTRPREGGVGGKSGGGLDCAVRSTGCASAPATACRCSASESMAVRPIARSDRRVQYVGGVIVKLVVRHREIQQVCVFFFSIAWTTVEHGYVVPEAFSILPNDYQSCLRPPPFSLPLLTPLVRWADYLGRHICAPEAFSRVANDSQDCYPRSLPSPLLRRADYACRRLCWLECLGEMRPG